MKFEIKMKFEIGKIQIIFENKYHNVKPSQTTLFKLISFKNERQYFPLAI